MKPSEKNSLDIFTCSISHCVHSTVKIMSHFQSFITKLLLVVNSFACISWYTYARMYLCNDSGTEIALTDDHIQLHKIIPNRFPVQLDQLYSNITTLVFCHSHVSKALVNFCHPRLKKHYVTLDYNQHISNTNEVILSNTNEVKNTNTI